MTDDTLQTGDIFPNEIWLEILSGVQGVEDSHRIRRAIPHLGNILHELRTKVLLRSVVKILYHHRDKKRFGKNWKIKLLLKCRTVCSNWKNGVDWMLQDAAYQNFRDNQNASGNFLSDNPPGCVDFKKRRDSRKFHKHFELTHACPKRNPFLSRCVRIELVAATLPTGILASLSYLKNVVTTFKTYGDYVWFLSVRCTGKALKFEVCQTMIKVLEHLPNLKVLQIHYSVRDSDYHNFQDYVSDQAEVETFIGRNPMRALVQLEVFKCDGVLPVDILKSLFKETSEKSESSRISCLEFSIGEFEPLNFLLPVATSLKYLSVGLRGKYLNYSEEELDRLDKEIVFYKKLELEKSNVWEIFPALQEIKWERSRTGRRYFCTREDWKTYKQIQSND